MAARLLADHRLDLYLAGRGETLVGLTSIPGKATERVPARFSRR
jgi:hypothetical protein